jgi:hypothetical protein
MNKFKCYFILLITTVSFFSCTKNNTDTTVAPRDYAVQYATDNIDIEEYLKTNYITVIDNPGFQDDQDVTITKIPDGGVQPSIISYLNSATYPKLLSRDVSLHNITYKLYYLILREGKKDVITGLGEESPCSVDGVFSSYKGNLLDGTVFDSSNNGQSQYNLDGTSHDGGIGVLTGWSEAFPMFKTGWFSSNIDGTINYHDFGSGVIFLPSGLGYYEKISDNIPAYSPLVFSIKLYALKRFDHDADGIFSYQEDVNGDGYMRTLATGVINPDDTDGDGIPNFLDTDDDGDNYSTKTEIKNPTTGSAYPFADIPTCTSGKKNYLDITCHP